MDASHREAPSRNLGGCVIWYPTQGLNFSPDSLLSGLLNWRWSVGCQTAKPSSSCVLLSKSKCSALKSRANILFFGWFKIPNSWHSSFGKRIRFNVDLTALVWGRACPRKACFAVVGGNNFCVTELETQVLEFHMYSLNLLSISLAYPVSGLFEYPVHYIHWNKIILRCKTNNMSWKDELWCFQNTHGLKK